mmetsp:Transcript_17323/g.39229  ORF Transcript_17323/g.39229 Transcript_17323/m.39229 type:complete len:280 (+) Transcript_17323:58-897(+)
MQPALNAANDSNSTASIRSLDAGPTRQRLLGACTAASPSSMNAELRLTFLSSCKMPKTAHEMASKFSGELRRWTGAARRASTQTPQEYRPSGRRPRRVGNILKVIEHEEAACGELIEALEFSGAAEEAIRAGATLTLVHLTKVGSPRQREDAATALSKMAQAGSTLRVRVVSMGGLEAIITLVRSGSPSDKAAGLVAMETFASTNALNIVQTPHCLDAIQRLASRGTPRQRDAAAAILKTLLACPVAQHSPALRKLAASSCLRAAPGAQSSSECIPVPH